MNTVEPQSREQEKFVFRYTQRVLARDKEQKIMWKNIYPIYKSDKRKKKLWKTQLRNSGSRSNEDSTEGIGVEVMPSQDVPKLRINDGNYKNLREESKGCFPKSPWGQNNLNFKRSKKAQKQTALSTHVITRNTKAWLDTAQWGKKRGAKHCVVLGVGTWFVTQRSINITLHWRTKNKN